MSNILFQEKVNFLLDTREIIIEIQNAPHTLKHLMSIFHKTHLGKETITGLIEEQIRKQLPKLFKKILNPTSKDCSEQERLSTIYKKFSEVAMLEVIQIVAMTLDPFNLYNHEMSKIYTLRHLYDSYATEEDKRSIPNFIKKKRNAFAANMYKAYKAYWKGLFEFNNKYFPNSKDLHKKFKEILVKINPDFSEIDEKYIDENYKLLIRNFSPEFKDKIAKLFYLDEIYDLGY